ncbi:GspE/PulE/PilB domain-containing protein [Pleurocapsa sp. FMAR1]|uniref:GspE/PulE/PilB domain-containing protein n=1 Tax=Pleurocapsa sp. FMAR1 TaxID=3040204 RepID=UPI0029C8AEBB|nr:hypothetical protein [Pleurocapsa sp. FMAR1]
MNNDSYFSNDIQAAMFADCLANSKEIFQLIDTVFPVDSCRHYQVLPLKLEDNNLTLGMLDPSDEESLQFVKSIAKVFHYNLTLNVIDIQTHEIILNSYPQNSQQQSQSPQDQNKTVIDTNFSGGAIPLNEAQLNRRKLADSESDSFSPKSNMPAGLEDLPPDLDFLRDLDLESPSPAKPAKSQVDLAATLYEIPPEFLQQKTSNRLDDRPTIIDGNPAELLAQSALEKSQAQIADAEIEIADLIEDIERAAPETVDFLPQLQSQLSWQKLLESAFRHYSDRLKLTRHSDRGGIVAQKDEKTQSSIKRLPLPTFCSLIDEIKRMARLPQNTSSHPQKVVLERIYEEERILLRLEFLVEGEDEIIIVQILRDRSLQIYEQKQMDRISEQALQLAQQLEKTLRKIQACFDSAELTNLRELQTVQSRINHQLRLLDKI